MLFVDIQMAVSDISDQGTVDYIARTTRFQDVTREKLGAAGIGFTDCWRLSNKFQYFDFTGDGENLEIWLCDTWKLVFETEDKDSVAAAIETLPLAELFREVGWRFGQAPTQAERDALNAAAAQVLARRGEQAAGADTVTGATPPAAEDSSSGAAVAQPRPRTL